MKFLILGDIGRQNLYHVGDEAMTEVAVKMLQRRGVQDITLVATDPQVATELYGLPAVERIGFGPKWTSSERDEVLEQARSAEQFGPKLAALAAAVERTDVVLIAGGGNMNQRFSHHLDERLALGYLARRFKKPLLVTSQTIGPQLGERERGQLREILQISRAFGLRDDDSFTLATSLSGSEAGLFRTADDGALFPVICPPSETPVETSRYVVASFTPDSGATGVGLHEYLDWIAKSLDAIASQLDADVLLIPHAGALGTAPQILDELSDRSLVERSGSGRIRALPPMVTSEIMPIMSGALLTISTRYHPVVFGPALGIPTLGITLSDYHTVRMRGALAPLGLDFCIVPFGGETVVHAAEEVTRPDAEYHQWFEPLAREQRAQQQAWWDFLASGGKNPDSVPDFPRVKLQGTVLQSAAPKPQVPRLRGKFRGVARRLRRLRSALKRRFRSSAGKPGAGEATAKSEPETSTTEARAPLLSVVIPVYNVEKYLRACVESVTSQSFKDLEIILIDDASTDSSAQIAQELAQEDERIRLFGQENRGLGAVRNRGLDLARGTYIAFVDSDDIVPPGSYREMIAALQRSGSDLVLGGVARLRKNDRLQDLHWSQELHDRDYSTTLEQTPRLLRDFYTWNKVFSRAFLQAHGFRFREGVLFEDQPVIAEILATANSIDVLEKITYHWRLRGDGSSLTGDMFSVRDIAARREAIALTRAALEKMAVAPSVWRGWHWTLLEHHFPYYLGATAKISELESYAAVVQMIGAVFSAADVVQSAEVSTPNRVLVYLALAAEREEVARFIAAGGRDLTNARIERLGADTVAHLPGLPEKKLPPQLGLLTEADHRLHAEMTRLDWLAPGRARVQCRAGITNLPAEADAPWRGTLSLVSSNEKLHISLAQSTRFSAEESAASDSGVRGWCEFEAEFDLADLGPAEWEAVESGLRFEVRLQSQADSQTAPSPREYAGGIEKGSIPLQGTTVGEHSNTVSVTVDTNRRIGLQVIPRMVTSFHPELRGGEFRLELKSQTPEFDIEMLRFKAVGERERRFIPRKTSPQTYTAYADLDWLPPGSAAQVTAIDSRGRTRRVHGQPGVALGRGLVTATNRFGALRIERAHSPSTSSTRDAQ